MNSKLRELKDKRNKLMTDAAALVRQENVTPEHRTQADAMLADVDLIDQDIAREERFAAHEAEQRAAGAPPRSNPGSNIDREMVAFERYLRSGQTDSALRERRDLTTGANGTSSPTGAGFLLPTGIANLTIAQKFYGPLTQLVNRIDVGHGSPMKVPTFNDVSRVGTVITETTASTESDPTVTGSWSYTDWVDLGTVRLSIPEARDSAYPIVDIITSKFAEAYYRTATDFITSGSSSGNVQSIVTTATAGPTSAAPTAIGWADVAGLYSSVDPSYQLNGTFMAHNSTFGALLSETDSLGRPLFTPAPSAEAFDTLLGRRVIQNPYMPTLAAGAKALMFGDFRQYTFREVGGPIIRVANELFLSTGEIGVVGFASIGGYATDAGTHPIKVLVQHS